MLCHVHVTNDNREHEITFHRIHHVYPVWYTFQVSIQFGTYINMNIFRLSVEGKNKLAVEKALAIITSIMQR